jgi:hypothetical protein
LVTWFVKTLRDFARELKRSPSPASVAETLTVKERFTIREDAQTVMTHMAELIQCIERAKTRRRFSMISGGANNDDKPAA